MMTVTTAELTIEALDTETLQVFAATINTELARRAGIPVNEDEVRQECRKHLAQIGAGDRNERPEFLRMERLEGALKALRDLGISPFCDCYFEENGLPASLP